MKKIPIVLFNILEMICVFLSGKLLHVDSNIILITMLIFVLVRMTIGKPLHYKSPYRCFIMTLLVFLSMLVLFKVDLYVSILITIFDAYLLTGRANVEDMFMWKGKSSKHQDVFDYIKHNSLDNSIVEFERKLKEQDNLAYLIYKYRFKDKLSFEEITNKLDIDSARISEIQDNVAFAFRLIIGI